MQVDIIKYVSIPILKKFVVDEDIDLKVYIVFPFLFIFVIINPAIH